MLVTLSRKADRIYGLCVLNIYIMPGLVILRRLKKQRLYLVLGLMRSYSYTSKYIYSVYRILFPDT